MNPEILLLLLIALFGIPAGMLISKYAKEELKGGKKYFKILMTLMAIAILASLIFVSDINQKSLIITVSGFVFFLAGTSLRKA